MTSIAPVDRRPRIPAVVAAALATLAGLALAALVASAAVAAGPPYPPPDSGVRVYDNADILSPDVEGAAQSTIDAIEARTGAQVVVYTQDVESGRSTDEADADARALMDEWGVGRKGFDDGLVILFDMYPGREHGQVILYGGPGFRATYLDNGEKQRIFDDEMLPRLKEGDF